jgi:2-keto-3-deoxy-L-rhamnonate aldolase RhmA
MIQFFCTREKNFNEVEQLVEAMRYKPEGRGLDS